jgi:chemotaxis protein MotB
MNMTAKIHIGIAVLAAAFFTSGCVSTGTFEKMQAGKNDEIKALQQQKTALEQDNTALKQQIASHEQQNSAMQQQVGSLEQEKAALLAASQQRQQQYDALVKTLSKEVERGQLKVRQYQNMLTVDLAEQIFFDSGRATLKAGGKDVLKKVGEALKGYENKIIRVVGYTDNVPVAKSLQGTYPTNWELSVARATTVVRFLQDSGVPPERMIASGRGEYDPVASNDTPEGRQKNRRIEIMLIDQSLANEMGKSIN